MHSYYIGIAGDDNNDARADPDDGLPPMLGSAESGASEMPSPLQALETFRQELLAENLPHQLPPVCRMDGEEELKTKYNWSLQGQEKEFQGRTQNEIWKRSGCG